MRLFAAIDLPEDQAEMLEALQDDLKVGRKMDPETFHLTLAFFDEQPIQAAQDLHVELEGIRAMPFELTLAGFDVFEGAGPQVLFAGIADPAPLAALNTRIRSAARAAGIEMPRTRFRPHVTIARFGKRMAAEEVESLRRFLARNAGFRAPAFTVEDFVLFESILGPGGARHEELARYPLI